MLVECYEADPAFDYTTVRRREGPLWSLVTQKPQHLLDPRYATWEELLLSAVDEVIEQTLDGRAGSLADRVWSDYNVTAYVIRCLRRCHDRSLARHARAGRCRRPLHAAHALGRGGRLGTHDGLPDVRPRA